MMAFAIAGVLAQVAPSAASTSVVRPVVTKSADGLLTWQGLPDPGVIETATGLYLTWVASPLPSAAPEHEELARVNATTGKVTAKRTVDGRVAGAVTAGRSLFVLVTFGGEQLLCLNPLTLDETGHWRIGHSEVPGAEASALGVAGGGVWVTDGDRLVRLTPTRGKIVASIAIPGAANADLATNDTGSVLLLGEANEAGVGLIQRRNPITGHLFGKSPQVVGIVNPSLTSVTRDDFWISESTGMMGYVQLYHLKDLAPVGSACHTGSSTETCIPGTNGIAARVSDGRLFVTQVFGGPAHNFCAGTDGHVLAALPIPASDGLLAVGRKVLFVLGPLSGTTQIEPVLEVAIPSACITS